MKKHVRLATAAFAAATLALAGCAEDNGAADDAGIDDGVDDAGLDDGVDDAGLDDGADDAGLDDGADADDGDA